MIIVIYTVEKYIFIFTNHFNSKILFTKICYALILVIILTVLLVFLLFLYLFPCPGWWFIGYIQFRLFFIFCITVFLHNNKFVNVCVCVCVYLFIYIFVSLFMCVWACVRRSEGSLWLFVFVICHIVCKCEESLHSEVAWKSKRYI